MRMAKYWPLHRRPSFHMISWQTPQLCGFLKTRVLNVWAWGSTISCGYKKEDKMEQQFKDKVHIYKLIISNNRKWINHLMARAPSKSICPSRKWNKDHLTKTNTICPQTIAVKFSASITFKITDQSKHSLGL